MVEAVTETNGGPTQVEAGRGGNNTPDSPGSGPVVALKVSPKPDTLTVEQQIEAAVHSAMSKAGRDADALATERAKLEAERAAFATQEAARLKASEDEEEAAIADDPPALQILRTERKKKAEEKAYAEAIAKREAVVAQKEVEIAEVIERDRILRRTELAAEVAVEKGVSVDALLKHAKADTREAYLELAAVLPKAIEQPEMIIDSGGKGGGGVRPETPDEYIQAGLKKLKSK